MQSASSSRSTPGSYRSALLQRQRARVELARDVRGGADRLERREALVPVKDAVHVGHAVVGRGDEPRRIRAQGVVLAAREPHGFAAAAVAALAAEADLAVSGQRQA